MSNPALPELPQEIPTERPGVVLRLLTPEDDEVYFESYDYSRKEIAVFDPSANTKYQRVEDVNASHDDNRQKGRVRYGIWDNEQYVGMIGQTQFGNELEVGYITDTRYRGNGYATLATRAMVNVDLPFYDRIFAKVVKGNGASVHILEKSGFVRTSQDIDPETGKTILVFDFDKLTT